ncbi:MAG: RNA-binding S4 domain-containing protein [Clostridia bacterium]|nr:RNA-binding S4 domain-containing protein [Clostridia bacterium]MBQ7289203.1 RNA-binding S4 domain-containing protein [Clostridia bacterium]
MRIDKYLKVSRIIKRRTVANEACDNGRVSVNGRAVRASYEIKENDIVEISFGSRTVKFRVRSIRDFAGKEDSACMYEMIE